MRSDNETLPVKRLLNVRSHILLALLAVYTVRKTVDYPGTSNQNFANRDATYISQTDSFLINKVAAKSSCTPTYVSSMHQYLDCTHGVSNGDHN